MLLVVGIYHTGKKHQKIDGIKVYDTVTKKMGLFPKKSVYDTVASGKAEVVGVKIVDVNGVMEGELSRTNEYNTARLDHLDEFGFPIGGTPNAKIPLVVEGFGKNTEFELLDSMGNIERVKYSEFIQLLRDRKIVGAYECYRNDDLRYSKHVKRNGILCMETT